MAEQLSLTRRREGSSCRSLWFPIQCSPHIETWDHTTILPSSSPLKTRVCYSLSAKSLHHFLLWCITIYPRWPYIIFPAFITIIAQPWQDVCNWWNALYFYYYYHVYVDVLQCLLLPFVWRLKMKEIVKIGLVRRECTIIWKVLYRRKL